MFTAPWWARNTGPSKPSGEISRVFQDDFSHNFAKIIRGWWSKLTILRTGHLGHLKIAGDKKKNTGLILWLPKGYHKTIPKRLSENKVAKNPGEKWICHIATDKFLQVFSFNSGQDRPIGDPWNSSVKKTSSWSPPEAPFSGTPTTGLRSLQAAGGGRINDCCIPQKAPKPRLGSLRSSFVQLILLDPHPELGWSNTWT